MPDFAIYDVNEEEIKVGTRCIYGAPDPEDIADVTVTVISISDPDGDVDDETGRGIEITPRVEIKFNDGTIEKIQTHNTTQLTWAHYPDFDGAEWRYDADDLEVVK